MLDELKGPVIALVATNPSDQGNALICGLRRSYFVSCGSISAPDPGTHPVTKSVHSDSGCHSHGDDRRSSPRSSWALTATITVDALMRTAAAAGASTIPAQAKAPAARGIATTL